LVEENAYKTEGRRCPIRFLKLFYNFKCLFRRLLLSSVCCFAF